MGITARLITKGRLAWTAIILILLLGLLFLPGVKSTLFHKGPVNTTDGRNTPRSISRIAPDSANRQATGVAESALPQGAMDPLNRPVLFHVIDAKDGRGIAGALLHPGEQPDPDLELPPSFSMTDAKGDCSVIVAPRTFVTVTATGYLNYTKSFPSLDTIPAEYTFRLEKGISIGGIVRNEAGQPIGDVRVMVRPRYMEVLPAKIPILETLMPVVVKTDASGRWHAQNAPPDPDVVVLCELTHPEYVQSRYWTDQAYKSPDGALEVNSVSISALRGQEAVFVMRAGFVVTGSVLGEDSKPIQSASISQRDTSLTLRMNAKSTTGADGRFSFIADKPQEMAIVAQAQGYAPASQKIRITPKMPPIQFRLAKGNVLTGRIVDEEGKAVPGAAISATTNLLFNRDYFPWQGKSDMDGTFLWDSAPPFPMYFSIRAEQYKNPNAAMPFFLLEPGKENLVRLQKIVGMQLTGKVFDQKTKAPIDKFKVTTVQTFHIPGRSDAHTSPSGPVVEGVNGEFTMNLLDKSLSVEKIEYMLRVEAAGYLPNTSQPIDPAGGDQTLSFAMAHGDGIQGVVKLPNGEVAVGAKVSIFGIPGRAPSMRNTGALSYSASFCETVATDEQGRFSLNPMPEAHTIAAVHEKGIVTAIPSRLGPASVLVLQPWGRVEGRMKVGNRDAINQRVFIGPLTSPSPPGIQVSLSGVTDSQGRFAIEKVPPTEYRVSGGAGTIAVIVKPGQTVSVTLGGTGRPVIGQFVMADPEAQITWTRLLASLSLILPDVAMPTRTDDTAYRAWAESEEGKQYLRSQVAYSVRTSADGSFRIEDVAAGKYSLSVMARETAEFKREVIVPEMPGGRSDEPLNLGTVTLQPPPKK